MQLHTIRRKTKNRKPARVGRGGRRGKTSGRGTKGQKARSGRKLRPELRDIIKRLPKMRGRGKNSFKSAKVKPVALNVGVLEIAFNAKDAVTPKILAEKGIIHARSGKMPAVKILGDGDITKALTISGCAVSLPAKMKIEKAGGTIA